MAKKYKTDDKLICLKDVIYGGSVIFSAGEYYTISRAGVIYYIVDGVSFQNNMGDEIGFHSYFGTLQKYRKLKLEKLKNAK